MHNSGLKLDGHTGGELLYLPRPPTVIVDVDELPSLQERGEFGVPVAHLDIIRLGKRITVNIELVDDNDEVVIRMTAVKKHMEITRRMLVRPWTPVQEGES